MVELHAATMPIEIRSAAARASRRRSARAPCRRSRGSSRRSARRSRPISTAMPRGDDADDQRRPRAVHRAHEEVAARRRRRRTRTARSGPFGRPNASSIVGWYDRVFGWPVTQAAIGPPKIAMKMRSDDHEQRRPAPPCPRGSAPRRAAHRCGPRCDGLGWSGDAVPGRAASGQELGRSGHGLGIPE